MSYYKVFLLSFLCALQVYRIANLHILAYTMTRTIFMYQRFRGTCCLHAHIITAIVTENRWFNWRKNLLWAITM